MRERFERVAPRTSPLPPHLGLRTPMEQESAALLERLADHRRRRVFESDDPVAW